MAGTNSIGGAAALPAAAAPKTVAPKAAETSTTPANSAALQLIETALQPGVPAPADSGNQHLNLTA